MLRIWFEFVKPPFAIRPGSSGGKQRTWSRIAASPVTRRRALRLPDEGRPPSFSTRASRLGNFASRVFYMFLRNCYGSFEETINAPSKVKKSSGEICGDDESTQQLRRHISKSWLVKFPDPYCTNSDRMKRADGRFPTQDCGDVNRVWTGLK